MKHEPYPEYRETGTTWLGRIPAHWNDGKTKHFADLRSGHTPSRSRPEYWAECTIPWFSLADVWQIRDGKKIYLSETKEKISELGLANSAADLLPAGSVIVSRTASVGFSGIMEVPMATTQDFVNWIPGPKLTSLYLLYVFRAMENEFKRLKMGSTHKTIYMPDVHQFSTPVPSLEEQAQITKFLDYETAKIDTLIEKQQQLIALLKEKRQAVISHAVTKGLNPDASMRDSGVEWLGEVPAHWATAKLGHRYEVLLGKMLDARKVFGDHLGRYLRNTDVQWDRINEDDLPEMDFRPHERERYSVRKGDLIVCEGGEIGRCAIWTRDYPCFYQKALHRLRPRHPEDDVPRFMFYHLFLAVTQERFIAGSEKATIAHLPAESFRQYRFTFPPHEEQQAIADALDAGTTKFDELEAKAQGQIELLRERRTALISSAVTGKIDVRGWEPTKAKTEVA